MKITSNREELLKSIELKIIEGNQLIELNISQELNTNKNSFCKWREDTIELLNNFFHENSFALKFESEVIYLENRFSKSDTSLQIKKAINQGITFLKRLCDDILNGVYDDVDVENNIPKEIAIIIIKRIMDNFYKYIEAMYESQVHGKAKILKKDLDKIKIGNEYDVQRILYSIIKPIFPLARLEVPDDTGYNSVRYDIYVDEYDVVIEVKCTRNSMTERTLEEEIGSDIYHYQTKNVFFFIYDKDKIIKNVDAFIRAYTRREDDFDKNVDAIVIQPVLL